MISITARDLKNNLGKMIEDAQSEIVQITKHKRPSAALISWKRLLYYQKLDEECLVQEVFESEKEGYIGHEASMQLLKDMSDGKEI